MPYPLTLTTADGTEAWSLQVPTTWADVSLHAFVQRFAGPSKLAPAEVLCGLPAGTLERLSVQAVQQLGNLLAFAADPSPVLELLPTPGLPEIGTMAYGTLLLAQQAIEEDPDRPPLAYGPRLLALYRVTALYGKADAAKVAACEAALLAAPVTESYGDLVFTMASYRACLSDTHPTPPMSSAPSRRKRKRARRSWRNALALCSAWILRRAARSSITPAP